MNKLLLQIILSITFFSASYAQMTQKQLLRVADDMFKHKDYYGAALYYKKAALLDSSDYTLLYQLAESYRGYNEYPKAAYYYLKVYKKDHDATFPFASYHLATMLQMQGKYKKAGKYFRRSKRVFRKDKKGFYYQKVIQQIASCKWALIHVKDAPEFEWQHIPQPVNSYSSDFSGVFLNDTTFLFSSLRDDNMKDDNVVTDTLGYLSKIYQTHYSNSKWNSELKEFSKQLKIDDEHIANGSLSPNGKVFYFSVCNRTTYKCRLYAATYNNGKLTRPFELKQLNTTEEYTSTQPFSALINGKEVLFFVSDRKGGQGGMDIWLAEKNEFGEFEEITNLKNINTIDDEITPFYNNETNELFFSSKWYKGFGGFDIFKTPDFTNDTLKPKNLGTTYNTPANDMYFKQLRNKQTLTSNREGGFTKKGKTCCNDLYFYQTKPEEVIEEKEFTTLDEMNRYLPLSLYFHNDEPNPRTRDTTTKLTYTQTYQAYIKLEKKYKNEYSKGLAGDEKEDAELDVEDFFEQYVRQGMQYLNEFTPLLAKELREGKHITLTIKGFASPLSKSDYNVNLTLRRIQSLINYLMQYNNGELLPYFLGAKNGGKLDFIKVPYGEYNSDQTVSDKLEDKKHSVYSPQAALQRKIEIIAITEKDNKIASFSGDSIIQANLQLDTNFYSFGNNRQIKITFYNNGNANLQIFNIEIRCQGCVEIAFPEVEIPPSKKGVITLTKNSSFPKNKPITFEIISNGVPSRTVFYVKE